MIEYDGAMITQFMAAWTSIMLFVTGVNQVIITRYAKKVYASRLSKWWEDTSREDFIDISILSVVAFIAALTIIATRTVDMQILTSGEFSNYQFLKYVDGLSLSGVFDFVVPDGLGWELADFFVTWVVLVGGSRFIHALDKLARAWFAAKMVLYKPADKPE